jgi:hypothetical protein
MPRVRLSWASQGLAMHCADHCLGWHWTVHGLAILWIFSPFKISMGCAGHWLAVCWTGYEAAYLAVLWSE